MVLSYWSDLTLLHAMKHFENAMNARCVREINICYWKLIWIVKSKLCRMIDGYYNVVL